MKRKWVLIGCLQFVLSLSLLPGMAQEAKKPSEQDKVLTEAEIMLQAKEYKKAILKIEIFLKLKEKARKDYASYLKALALYYSDQSADAAKICETIGKTYPGSKWLRKARFLKAQAFIKLKRH